LAGWDAFSFCRLLGRRRVFFIGDSTLDQVASTLDALVFFSGAGCAGQIQWVAADTLVGEWFGWYNRGSPWWEVVERHTPGIVVLGVGPYIFPTGELHETLAAHARVIRNVTKSIRRMAQRFPNMKVLWKTISGAHSDGCNASVAPLGAPPDFAAMVAGMPSRAAFVAMDAHAVHAMRNAGVGILDFSPLYLRPDAHPPGDCLHYCTPGPLDLVGRLLLQALK